MRKAKMAPMMALIQRHCRAGEMPHWSAPQPTIGEMRPPMVVVRPRGDAGSETDVLAEVSLAEDDDGAVGGEEREGDGEGVAASP